MPTPPEISSALSDRYVIEREIGAGGMATVYLARDKKLDREVALKVLRPELGAVLGSQRFLTEIKISARLDHPHILTLIDSGEADGRLYYVLPYVRGESLRAKLLRERQLGLEEALTIAQQVASALDYAHRQGLVHRDIKPENILLQEGEAMLTDFGIALAVTEAGGGRLTETGLSLGTPQYMSPEQATGDRTIDARSDVYSLAAVFYEMLAGEPPVTGVSPQAMIAKLMTEKPTHLRVLRDTIPPGVDAAVAKALAKTPADRFASAGDFARALAAGAAADAHVGAGAAPATRRTAPVLAGLLALAVVIGGGAYALRARRAPEARSAVLGLKTQLTAIGAVLVPAISPDAKQLAYVTRRCESGACAFAVQVQDVGGTTTHTILDGASSAFYLEWSPDRRNLVLSGTVNGRPGTYLLSALGGTPRFLTGGVATFYAGGDSLLLGPAIRPDSVYWVRVAALNGDVRDSIRVAGPGQGLAALSVVPGTSWIVSLVLQEPHGLWQVVDRSGRVVDHVVNACTCGGIATSDAVWLARKGHGNGESVVRIALDRATGRLAAKQDTMLTGVFSNFSLTADGGEMVMDEGILDYSVWALPLDDLLHGRYSDDQRITHASSSVSAVVSPDGGRLLFRRLVPTGGRADLRYSVAPFAGGAETPIASTIDLVHASWVDSVTVAIRAQTPSGLHLAEVDVRTGAQRNGMDLPDSEVTGAAALSDGWAWIPAAGDRIVVRQGKGGKSREFTMPKSYTFLNQLALDPSGQRLFYLGGNDVVDSAGVGALALGDGSMTQWGSTSGQAAHLTVLTGGAVLLEASQAQGFLTFFRLAGPGQMQRVGATARPVLVFAVSSDMKRGSVMQRDYHADAWLYKVIR